MLKCRLSTPETGMKIIPQQMVSYTKDSVVMDFQTPQFQTQFENQYGKCGRYEFILRAHNELGNYEAYYNSDVRFFINLPHETDEWQMNETQHWKICSNPNCPDGRQAREYRRTRLAPRRLLRCLRKDPPPCASPGRPGRSKAELTVNERDEQKLR